MSEDGCVYNISGVLRSFFEGVLAEREGARGRQATAPEDLYRALSSDEIARAQNRVLAQNHYCLDDDEVVAIWKSYARAIARRERGKK